MEHGSIMQQLLEENRWDKYQPLMDRLRKSEYWPDFEYALAHLNRDALYVSSVHGEDHIERVLLHGAFCAMEDHLDHRDTELLLNACSYHDVGRINDDLDPEHGRRSAEQLEALTGCSGEDLLLMQAAVDAHSRSDRFLERTIRSYQPEDYPRALRLAQLLKDADGLDRVRLDDLDPGRLRRRASMERVDFALYLYARYEIPMEEVEKLRNQYWSRKRQSTGGSPKSKK